MKELTLTRMMSIIGELETKTETEAETETETEAETETETETEIMTLAVFTFLVLNMPRCIIGVFELSRWRGWS
jgi:hypothetical protein